MYINVGIYGNLEENGMYNTQFPIGISDSGSYLKSWYNLDMEVRMSLDPVIEIKSTGANECYIS